MRSTAAGRSWLVPLVLALLVASTAGGVATGVVDAAATTQPEDQPPTVWTIDVQRDGDARFSIEMQFTLDTDERRAAFERMRREFENGSNTQLSPEPFRQAASLAANVTERAMGIGAVRRTSRIENDTGVLSLSFTWDAFAQVDGDRLILGDVFQTPDGTWLPQLTEDQVLRITFPRGYSPESLVWPVRDGAVYIEGPVSFSPGQPSATFVDTGSTPTVSPTPSPTPTATPTDPGSTPTPTTTPGPLIGMGPIAGLVLLLLAVAAIAVFAWRTDGDLPGWVGAGDDGPSPGTGGEPSGAAGGGSTTGTDTTSADAAAPGGAAQSVEDESEELLSDEERVLRLLEENDGRMKQAKIVEETDWSNAKVSQLLSEMAEDGEVEKLRIGRENLISLPDQGPAGVE